MKLLRTLKITAILLIVNFSIAYGQGNITTHLVGGDTLFVMDRTYAEMVAERFDSLIAYKLAFAQCDTAINGLQSVIKHRHDINKAQAHTIDGLKLELDLQNDLIDSYKRSQAITDAVKHELKLETRRRKRWRVLAVVGFGAGIGGIVWGISR